MHRTVAITLSAPIVTGRHPLSPEWPDVYSRTVPDQLSSPPATSRHRRLYLFNMRPLPISSFLFLQTVVGTVFDPGRRQGIYVVCDVDTSACGMDRYCAGMEFASTRWG